MSASAQLILLALLCTGYSDFLYKKAQAGGASVGKFMTLQSLAFLTMQIVCCVLFGFSVSWDVLILGLVGGTVAFASFGLLYVSMKHGDASVNSTIFRMGFIVTSCICIAVFGEVITVNKVVGTAGAIGAMALMSLAPGARWARVGFPLLAACCFGFLRFLHRSAGLMHMQPWSLLLIQSAVFQICTQIARRRESLRDVNLSTLICAPVCGLLLSGAAIACIFALRIGDASNLVPASQLGFLITTPLACLALREHFDRRKALALALAACSVLTLLV